MNKSKKLDICSFGHLEMNIENADLPSAETSAYLQPWKKPGSMPRTGWPRTVGVSRRRFRFAAKTEMEAFSAVLLRSRLEHMKNRRKNYIKVNSNHFFILLEFLCLKSNSLHCFFASCVITNFNTVSLKLKLCWLMLLNVSEMKTTNGSFSNILHKCVFSQHIAMTRSVTCQLYSI